jgi:hypothetical protein
MCSYVNQCWDVLVLQQRLQSTEFSSSRIGGAVLTAKVCVAAGATAPDCPPIWEIV